VQSDSLRLLKPQIAAYLRTQSPIIGRIAPRFARGYT
jgi:hypothetical protein